MDLLICEKPSQAMAYAKALGINERGNGCLKGNGYVLTWCVGHIMEMPYPDYYNSAYKKWVFDDLPIIPSEFKLLVSKDKKKQYKIICDLLKKSSRCFICTDFDREGEAIAREVLDSVNYNKSVLRVKCSSYEASDMRRAFKEAFPGSETINKYYAQQGRSRADWLVGINLSRAIGLAYNKKTNKRLGNKSGIGRVLTPMLNICVLREKAIRDFKPQEYFKIEVQFASPSGDLRAELVLPEEFQNDQGGLDNFADATALSEALIGKNGQVNSFTDKLEKEYAPLPFIPSTLCLETEKNNISLNETKSGLQKLYESGFVTYPRTDNAYLPKSMFPQVERIFSHLGAISEYDSHLSISDPTRVSKCWKDVDASQAAHHGIVPTAKPPERNKLTATEIIIYDLITKRFLQQFMEPREFKVRTVKVNVGDFEFAAKSKEEFKAGWHITQSSMAKNVVANFIPQLEKGDQVVSREGFVVVKNKTKPKRFTSASLLTEMGNAAKYISDSSLKNILKKTGLGTEATQIDILNKELTKKTLILKAKKIHVPLEIEEYIDFIPNEIKSVETTALWEEMLGMIETGDLPLNDFMNEIHTYLDKTIGAYQL